MTLRGIDVQNYTFDLIREAFIELFCAPKSSIENPSFRVSGQGRNFCVLDYGECEGSSGYWAMDEETGEEGFLEEYNEVFWTYDETNDAWLNNRVVYRKMTKGKGKGKKGKKGKGKGSKGRKWFRPYGKGKGQKGPDYADFGKGKGKGKKGKGKDYKGGKPDQKGGDANVAGETSDTANKTEESQKQEPKYHDDSWNQQYD